MQCNWWANVRVRCGSARRARRGIIHVIHWAELGVKSEDVAFRRLVAGVLACWCSGSLVVASSTSALAVAPMPYDKTSCIQDL